MNKYNINNYSYTSVKYNYAISSQTLYIHLYLDIDDKTKGAKFQNYNNNKGNWYKTNKSKNTYKQLVKKAISTYWNKTVTGDKYDFKEGVKFKTKVVLHDKDKKQYTSSEQKFINIVIGDKSNSGKLEGEYWFFADDANGHNVETKESCYYWSSDIHIHIPTQDLLYYNFLKNKKTGRGPESSEKNYMNSVAHEIGHCLGLADGYEKNGVKRSLLTNEIGVTGVVSNSALHIMDNSRRAEKNYGDVFDNDIEMIINAQSMGMKLQSYSVAAYKTYYFNGVKFKKSKVIRKK